MRPALAPPSGPIGGAAFGVAAAFIGALLLALLIALLHGVPRIAAHAAYERSEPAFAAELETAPARLDLWFSQQLFRQAGANTFALLDAEGSQIAAGELSLDRDDRSHAFAEISLDLPPGRYFIAWVNLSADDGDDDEGRSVFYVGRAATAAEIEEDRVLAAELLVPYPGDADQAGATGDAPPPPRPVEFADGSADDGIDAAVIGIAVAGVVAVLGLVAAGPGRRAS